MIFWGENYLQKSATDVWISGSVNTVSGVNRHVTDRVRLSEKIEKRVDASTPPLEGL